MFVILKDMCTHINVHVYTVHSFCLKLVNCSIIKSKLDEVELYNGVEIII